MCFECMEKGLFFFLKIFAWVMPSVTAKFQLNYILVLVETTIVMFLCFVIKIILSKCGKVSRFIIGK